MTKTPPWRRYLRFWRPDIRGDVDDELRFHADMRVEEFVARGMTEDEARRAVAARLGDVDAAREECVELGKVRATHARNADVLEGVRADIRYTLRSLGRTPGWTTVALLTIALGVGATTAVFRVADRLIVRPIRYPDASRVFVFRRLFDVPERQLASPFSAHVVDAFRKESRSIEVAAAFHFRLGMLGTAPDTIPVHVAIIDTDFLPLAGAHPVIGRSFAAEDARPNGPGVVAMLGEDMWRQQFGASTSVIGSVVKLNGDSRTIIGVMPSSVTLPDARDGRIDIWVPYDDDLVDAVAVRLKPGVPRDAATEELAGILTRAATDSSWWRDMRYHMRLQRPQDMLSFRGALAMLTGAVALLLLVACTNVAHLLLARGAARQREIAVRHALGASRWRLVRQLVTETLVIAVIGGAFATAVAWIGLHVMQAARPQTLAALAAGPNEDSVISLTALLAIGAGLAIGLASALRNARRDPGLALRANSSGTAMAGRRLRGALVIGEIGLSTTLLVGALLLTHALYTLEAKQLGFDAGGLYSVSFRPPRMPAAAQQASLVDLVRERAKAIPGAQRITVDDGGHGVFATLQTPDRATVNQAPLPIGVDNVDADYFTVLGIPLLAGRIFDDGSRSGNEVIVNTTLARMLAPHGSPLGRRFRNSRPIGFLKDWMTVIGVVPDVVDNLLVPAPQPRLYQPIGPNAPGMVTLYVRLSNNSSAESLAHLAASIQPSGSKPVIESVRDKIDQTAAEPRFAMRIMIIFASLGVLLAAIGLFGVISYSVAQRTREIGVRMTLGATRASIARLVVGDGLRLAVIGIVVGLIGGVAGTRLIEGVLYGVPRLDPFAFSAGAVLLLAVAVVACVIPMWRATGVDPVIAVRAE
ncbi:MAG TPA: ADOP family duplicated permease [Gemmatimonadaceae bacterium]|jgi:predicted permease